MATITGAVDNEQDQQQQDQPQQPQLDQPQGGGLIASAPGSAAQQFNQNQQAPQQRQIGSGRFTNIQQYLSANKQAGQQLGQTLQKGIGQKFGQAQATAGRELGEAQQQQTATTGLYGQGIQQYQQLGGQQAIGDVTAAPVQGAIQQQQYVAPTSETGFAPKGTSASEYTANIGTRQQTAAEIAANQQALQQFAGLRTGTAQQEQESLVRQQAEQARQSAEALKQQHEQRMRQLATETGRSGLLGEFAGGRDYTGAKRSLDLAFLQRDPGRALDALKQNIGAKREDVQRGLGQVGEVETQEGVLRTRGQELSKGLTQQTQQNVQDFVQNLESRIDVMEQQRGQKMDWARQQLEDFKGGKTLNKDFLDLIGVKEGTQLFNVPKNIKEVGEFLDVEDLQKQLNVQNVANQQDVAAYSALAQLAGLSPGEYQISEASKLKDLVQYGAEDTRTIQNRAEQARKDFLKDAAQRIISGTSTWVGGQQGRASQNLLDFLTGGSDVSKEVISNTGAYSGSDLSRLLEQGGQIGAQIAPYVGSAIGTAYGGPLGGMAGSIAGQLAGGSIIQAGQQLGQAADIEGGEYERAQHLALQGLALPFTTAPGTLGEAGRNVTGVAHDFISGIAGIGDTRDTAADIRKDVGYARRRSESYLENALADYLKNAGFYNYMGQEGLQTAAPTIKGSWDANTWYQPKSDLAKFGYGSTMLGLSGQYDPTRTEVPNIALSPLEQATNIGTADQNFETIRQLLRQG